MIKAFTKFIALCLGITIVLIPFNYFVLEELLQVTFDFANYAVYTYFVILSLIVQFVLMKGVLERPQKFVVKFMAAMGIKMFLSLILLVAHIYFNREGMKIFAVNFTLLYLIYSSVGIFNILKFQGGQKPE